jgi:hypothetical protein
MIKLLTSFLLSLASAFCQLALANDLAGTWTLEVRDLKQQQLVVAKVRFTDQSASSCTTGTWNALVVESISKRSDNFFPIAESLAYSTEEGTLTLGRAKVCDGYLFLSGAKHPRKISGNYNSVDFGGVLQLGTFTLLRSP